MITLYHNPKTRSIRPLILLEELGVPYEITHIDLAAKQHKSPEYLKVHPLGQLPALVDGETTLIESIAICIYLADRYLDKGLAPPLDSPERGPYLQWCLFSVGTIEPAFLAASRAKRVGEPDPAAEQALGDALNLLVTALGDRETLLPSGFSTADILIGSSLLWVRMVGVTLPEALDRYCDRLAGRPSFRKAFEPPAS